MWNQIWKHFPVNFDLLAVKLKNVDVLGFLDRSQNRLCFFADAARSGHTKVFVNVV